MSWCYHLEDRLRFPFAARGVAARDLAKEAGEQLTVLTLAPDDGCRDEALDRVRWQGRRGGVRK